MDETSRHKHSVTVFHGQFAGWWEAGLGAGEMGLGQTVDVGGWDVDGVSGCSEAQSAFPLSPAVPGEPQAETPRSSTRGEVLLEASCMEHSPLSHALCSKDLLSMLRVRLLKPSSSDLFPAARLPF